MARWSRRPLRPRSLLRLPLIAALLLAAAAVAVPGRAVAAASRCFPEATGKCIQGRFLDYWLANGDLAQQGYPLTDEFDEVSPTNGKSYRVQYFERARFEYHPENAAPYDVLLGLLGREQFQAKYPNGAPAGVPAGTGCTSTQVPGTRCINSHFGQYYLGHGALAQQGYAITDAFDEVSPTNGKSYLVQYFERARFEYHPEYDGTPYVVLLGLLGREQFLAKYPGGQPGGAAPIALQPGSLDFGAVAVGGASGPASATIVNNTAQVLLVKNLDLRLAGAHPGDFAIKGGTCFDGDVPANGGRCTVTLFFRPTASGSRAATLAVQTNAGPSGVIALTGTGTR